MAPLAEFTTGWTGTTASYLQLVDTYMAGWYLDAYRPVISSRWLGHVTFIPSQHPSIGGKIVECPLPCKNSQIKKVEGNYACTFTCSGCKMFTTFTVGTDGACIHGDNDHRFGRATSGRIVQTSFPIPKKMCDWSSRPSPRQ